MRSIWMGIDSTSETPRVLATAGASETVLSARPSATAKHPRAMPMLLEAMAMWEEAPVHAAFIADVSDSSSATRVSLDAWAGDGAALYSVEVVPRLRRRHREGLGEQGPFHDLAQHLSFEVAR